MNFLTENHVHSKCSPDAFNTMTEMALASYEKGVRKLCFTDHCDLDNNRTGKSNPDCYNFRDKMLEMFEKAKAEIPGDMELFLGLELGEGNHDPKRMAEIASDPALDFVIGSLHNLKDTIDFYDMEYPDVAFCNKMLDRYMEELIEISLLDSFDVMAHVCYPLRYMRKKGIREAQMNLQTHGDGLKTLFKNLIENGRGIEVNCSGLRNEFINATIPPKEVVGLYKELGGEIITIGSDAHRTQDAAFGLREGLELIRELGFKYVTIFKGRKPEFIKI